MAKSIVRFFCFMCSLVAIAAGATPYVEIDESETIKLVEDNLWFKTQPQNANPNFEQITQLFAHAEPVLSTIGGTGAYVTKINISNTFASPQARFVKLHSNYLDIGTAYWQPEQGKAIDLKSFGQMDGTNPKLAHSQAFSIALNSQASGTLWIYIQAKQFATPVTVTIYSEPAFYQNQFTTNSISTITFSVMLTLGLIACFIYFRTQYLVTLACAGYIGLHGLGWFVASGSFGHLFNGIPFNPVYFGMLIFPFAIACACQFTKLLFNCQQDHPRLATAFNTLAIASMSVGILMLFLSFNAAFILSHVVAAIWTPLCIGTGLFMLSKNDFRAKYYLIGNLVYGLSLSFYIVSHLLKLNGNIYPELIVQIALTIDCACILMSLAEWLQIQQKEYRHSYAVSRIDPLTQIGNRFAQTEKLAGLTGGYCLTFIDLDGFKAINDKHGHDMGDKCLVETVDVIQNHLGRLGVIFRSGGDEFILVTDVADVGHSERLIKTISSTLLNADKALQQTKWQGISFSFGIASSFETANQSDCLALADQRMYQHKQDKKNERHTFTQTIKPS